MIDDTGQIKCRVSENSPHHGHALLHRGGRDAVLKSHQREHLKMRPCGDLYRRGGGGVLVLVADAIHNKDRIMSLLGC